MSGPRCTLVAVSLFIGCQSEPSDDPRDRADESFAGPKADGFCVEAGTADGLGVMALVNDPNVSLDDLDAPVADGGAGLNRTAAENIIAARPLSDLEALDAVPYVGVATCNKLRVYACDVLELCTPQNVRGGLLDVFAGQIDPIVLGDGCIAFI